jgi:hypothetical protein
VSHACAHCDRPLVALNAYRACAGCGRVFSGDGAAELSGPVGIRIRCRFEAAPADGSYRRGASEGKPTLTLSRAWRVRWAFPAAFATFGSVFLAFWGGVVAAAGLGLIGGHLHVQPAVAIVMGLVVLGLASALGYLAAALLLNRTTVSISATEISRHHGPIPWGPPVRILRAPGDGVSTSSVGENDVRNLAARWPAPTSHRVHLTRSGSRETVVLIEQIGRFENAIAIERRIADLLAATAST